MGLDVIGAGFGRTGTLSLKLALDELGFGPTYHMEEVFRHPSDVARWHDYARTGRVDWERLFRGYRSAVDFPAACAWRALFDRSPEAKVILTVRDPDRWWTSTATTIYWARDMFPPWLRRVVPLTDRYLDMNERLVWDGIFAGRFSDRPYVIRVFEEHVASVRAAVPDDRLLVFDVAEGWEPLCAFLDVPVPRAPFPRANDAASMRRRIGAVKLATRALPVIGALAATGVFVSMIERRGGERRSGARNERGGRSDPARPLRLPGRPGRG